MPHPSLVAFHIFDQQGKKQTIDDLINGTNQATWQKPTGNKLGHLADGIPGRLNGSGIIDFIKKVKSQE
eukprot:5255906-Ditylum_brightwellii.AAC.1